ncbi:hypothetical protein VPNG_09191 [Cytospora leucostoma]|uniref:Secondary alcohol dehydrogenase n=1 Tax=Cytospora leucostoma TaxID=1230097 RepID=A0A423VU45_9PEZI|nr:hypothetical protein VPNG_09191 [Cytospora leucostoma]
MSSETLPISPGRFAEAIRDLSAASLHLKTLEIRNSLAHLAYSNSQLRPFAEGTLASLDATGPGQPDPDCVDAMRENELVMARMRERLGLVRAEVERRGLSWSEFEEPLPKEEDGVEEEEEDAGAGVGHEPASLTNGVNGHAAEGTAATTAASSTSSSGRNPWADGTLQTGVIRNGEVHMDPVPGQGFGVGATTMTGAAATTTAAATAAASNTTTAAAGPGQGTASGGRLSDDELRRLLEERLAGDGDDEDGGLHL